MSDIARKCKTLEVEVLIIVNTGKQRILTEERVNGALHKLCSRRTCARRRIKQSDKEPLPRAAPRPRPRRAGAPAPAARNNTHSDDNAPNDLEASLKMIRKWEY